MLRWWADSIATLATARSPFTGIEIRQGAFAQRHGTRMPDNHGWLQQRHRELASLDAITDALREAETVTGAGVSARTDLHRPDPPPEES